jgi:hypothetical protein
VIAEFDEIVDSENTKENGSPILATGGTCELIGNDIVGAALESAARSRTTTQARTGDAIVTTVKAVSLPPNLGCC